MENPKENPRYVEFLAEDTKLGADDAAALPVRLDRYSKAHHRALDMANYAMKMADVNPNAAIADYQVKLSIKLRGCGAYLLFRDYYTVGKVRLHAANFCKKHLLCPLCAIRRGAKMLKSYLDKLKVILAENPNLKPYLVTLTVKDGGDLRERFDHLQSSLKLLHKARVTPRMYSEACKADGAVWSYEFKRGKNSGDWHPHVHAVWLCEEAPDQAALSAQWKKITGDSFIVDVRPFHDDQDVIGGFLEVFKYAVKFSDLPLADNWDGFEMLSNKRLIASFGLFRGVEVPEDLTDEPLDDLPFVEMLYKHIFGVGYSLAPDYDRSKILSKESSKEKVVRPKGAVQVAPPEPYKKGRAHLLHLRKKYGD